MRPLQQLLRHGLFCAHSSGWLVLLYSYNAEAAVRATLMRVMQTEALQHRLCSSVMRQCNGESLELLESGLNVPESELHSPCPLVELLHPQVP